MDVRFPIGELEVPDHVTLEDIQAWIEDIGSYTNRLRATVDGLDSEDLNKTYREGSWNVRQLVHHIADSQVNMYQRLKLALTDDNPSVTPFIQDEWVKLPDSELPIECSVKLLEGINERIVAIGQGLNEAQLKRVFTLNDNGEISVAKKIAKLSWHENHHLEHIKIALSQ
ncbi:putative metal-dependent hydrolase [Staphylococcus sp. GSSP0090]|nr:putative metal-dependent hydrolase [Staphylococcus sp. GSSP0090]